MCMSRDVVDLIEEYLIHSYLYYVLCDTAMEDADFDRLCREISRDWDKLESPFKDEVDVGDGILFGPFQLKGQDGYEESYSDEIKRIALIRLREYKEMLEVWRNIK